jgi:hypothetical protein
MPSSLIAGKLFFAHTGELVAKANTTAKMAYKILFEFIMSTPDINDTSNKAQGY